MTLLTDVDVDRAVAARIKAQKAGLQALADDIRTTLLALHIELTDSPHGTTWKMLEKRDA